MSWLWGFALSVIAVLVAGRLVSGVQIKSITSAAIVALVLSLGGFFLQIFFEIFLIPLNLITLGVFSRLISFAIGVLVNVILVRWISKKISGFEVESFSSSLWYGIALAITQGIIWWIF
jgi:putative membrane protein